MKTSLTALENLEADLRIAEANLKSIKTEINQYAYITSLIDGIVLERNVNVGDMVVESSGSNSPSVFTLAENLIEMQIEASVGQLDVVSLYRVQTGINNGLFTGIISTEDLEGKQVSGWL